MSGFESRQMKSSARSRQIVLEAAPGVQPNQTGANQGDASGVVGTEPCEVPQGHDCEDGSGLVESYDWDCVTTW